MSEEKIDWEKMNKVLEKKGIFLDVTEIKLLKEAIRFRVNYLKDLVEEDFTYLDTTESELSSMIDYINSIYKELLEKFDKILKEAEKMEAKKS